jgi:hypothetical protein
VSEARLHYFEPDQNGICRHCLLDDYHHYERNPIVSNTPREERNIADAIAAADAEAAEAAKGVSLWESVITMGKLYVELKDMGVDKENILDLIRIPFMFAAVPDKPEMVTSTLADIDAKRKDN